MEARATSVAFSLIIESLFALVMGALEKEMIEADRETWETE